MSSLEERIRVAEDIERIKELKAHYAAACDNNYDADAIAALFTEDAVWDGGALGEAEGREKIRRFFRRAPEIFPFAIHNVTNPDIGMDGDRPVRLAAVYHDEYVRTGEQWMIRHLRVSSNLTSYNEGRAKRRFI